MSTLLDRLTAALAGRYAIERQIGAGGMATVYLAHDLKHERQVALKVLRPELAAALGPERFTREIKIAAQLQHPHILPLHDSGEADGFLYYVMPYVQGDSLRDRITRSGELPIDEAVRILREVVDALAHAHEKGVVHRDIKPDNVMLSGRHALVTDFGVAKAVSEATGRQQLTTAGLALGTPAYMSPEQATADPHVDHRTDVYAVGVLAYEMLTGRPPFTGHTPQMVLAAHVTKTPEPVTKHRDSVPPELEQAVMKCLAKKAADRWQSGEDLLQQLETAVTPSGGTTPTGTAPVPSVSAETALRHTNPGRVMALFGLAAAAVLGVTYGLMMQLGLPDWVMPVAVALLVLGLPVVMLTGRIERRRARARVAHSDVPARKTALSAWLDWRKAVLGGGLAFAGLGITVAAYMGMRLLGIGPVGTLVASGVIAERPQIVLADFADRTGDSALAATVTEALRIDLGQSGAVRLLQPSAIADVLERMRRPAATPLSIAVAREIGEREGLDAVLAGEVAPAGVGFLLTARLEDPATRDVLLSLRETARDSTRLIDTIDRLSRTLRERIGESFTSTRNQPRLSRAATTSLPALRKYTEAVRLSRSWVDPAAVPLLEQALALDSSFAAAWDAMGIILNNLNVEPGRRVQAAANSYRLLLRFADADERSRMQPPVIVTGDYQGEIEARDLSTPTNSLGYNYLMLRQPARAEEVLRRVIEQPSVTFDPFFNLVVAQVAQGRVDAARSTLRLADSLGVEHPVLEYMALALALDPEDQPGLSTVLNSVMAVASAQPTNNLLDRIALDAPVMSLAGLLGRPHQSHDASALLRGALERLGFIETYLGYEIMWAHYLLNVVGDSARAQDAIDSALIRHPLADLPPLQRPYVALAGFHAESGRPRQARALLAEYEREIEPELRGAQLPALSFARGKIALAEGDFAVAIDEFRRADTGPCPICVLPALAHAYDLDGRPDSAVAIYERYLETPWNGRILTMGLYDGPILLPGLDPYYRAGILRRLGELYEGRNDVDRAVEYYDRFVNLWQDAEAELQPQVADVRQRIARLVGEGRR